MRYTESREPPNMALRNFALYLTCGVVVAAGLVLAKVDEALTGVAVVVLAMLLLVAGRALIHGGRTTITLSDTTLTIQTGAGRPVAIPVGSITGVHASPVRVPATAANALLGYNVGRTMAFLEGADVVVHHHAARTRFRTVDRDKFLPALARALPTEAKRDGSAWGETSLGEGG